MKKEKKTIKAWITVPPDIDKWKVGSLIYSTRLEAELQQREWEKIYPCEIIILTT